MSREMPSTFVALPKSPLGVAHLVRPFRASFMPSADNAYYRPTPPTILSNRLCPQSGSSKSTPVQCQD
jgi:hypothetical protein